MGSAVDPTGLSFTVTKKDGTTASVSPQTLTPTTWGDTVGTQTCTFTYSDGYDSVSCDVEANVQAVPVVLTSLSVTGTPATQYVGSAPDLTGLTFKAVYSDTSEESLDASDISVSPATWSTSGSATLTCSYTEDEVTVSANVSVTVEPITVEGISLITDTGTQKVGQAVDYSGMTFELSLNTGETDSLSGSDLTEGALLFTSTAIADGVWTTSGSQSLTITINSESAFWSGMGVEIATPAPSTTASVTVAEE